ncbi:hypothetical protein ASF30_09000 [Leifsonia sp. Leaf264]|nr:hypothetical protein ASF30_09000 [Leifsonia sp. Leaf264]
MGTVPDTIAGTSIVELDPDVFAQIVDEKPKKQSRLTSRFKLLDLNQMWIVLTTVAVFLLILGSSMVYSFNTIVKMSAWMGPDEAIKWLPAIFIDMTIIGCTAALAQFKNRGTASKRAVWLARFFLFLSTVLSVVANASHTIDYWEGDLSTFQSWIGVLISSLIPIFSLGMTEILIYLAFVDPDEEDAQLKKRAKDRAKRDKERNR